MLPRDTIVRSIAAWMINRITGKRASREDVVNFLVHLSPEERDGIWKLRTFYARHSRGHRQPPSRGVVRPYGPRDMSL